MIATGLHVGPAGWSYADWERRVYPSPKPRGFHPLAHLARFVDCVELNASFYRTPRARDAERWVQLVADHPRFAFTAKILQLFTHGRPASHGEAEGEAAAWRAGIAPLADSGRLRGVLAQFPVSLRDDDRARRRLEWIATTFGDLGLIVELRHASWFRRSGYEFLRGLGASLAWIDLPAARDHPPDEPEATGPIGYLRLHGRNANAWFDRDAGRDQRYDYLYSRSEIAALVERARRLAKTHEETFVVTNNHFGGKAVANALEILEGLSEGDEKPLAPSTLVDAFPHLRGRVRVEGQGELFE